MKLTYFGHCAVQVELNDGTTLLFDPFRNDGSKWVWFKDPFPALSPDYLIITHPHFDHDNVDGITGTPTIIRHPISLSTEQFQLSGMLDKHARGFGEAFGAWNIIFTLEAEGVRLCHWGDNRSTLSDEQWAQLGRVDVLFVTVDDDEHLLGFEEVEEIIERLQPKVVIPTHYFMEQISAPNNGLAGIDAWISEQPIVSRIPSASVTIASESLPSQTEAWVFDQVAGAGGS